MKNFVQRLFVSRHVIGCFAILLLWMSTQAHGQWATNGNDIYNTNTGNVGVGTSAPGTPLQIVRDWNASASTNIMSSLDSYDDQSRFILRRANGNVGSATQVLSGQNLGGFQFRGWTSAGSFSANSSASVTAVAAENFTGTGIGASLQFTTTAVGSTTPAVRLTVDPSGYVGVATTAPAFRLDVRQGKINSDEGFCINGDCRTAWSQMTQWTTSGSAINYASGNVGIGVPVPTAKLDVNGTVNATSLTLNGTAVISSQWANGTGGTINFSSGNVGIGVSAPTSKLHVAGTVDASGFTIGGSAITSSQWATNGTTVNYATGNVGIATPNPTEKLQVTGNVKVSGNIDVGGNINAKYQDMAEWVESSQELSAGTVVILDPTKANQVIASTQSYDSRVAGVISLQPGLLLGEAGEGRVLVAATGRVKVKVDATNSPINIGDLLVTSDKQGMAMKSVPVDVAGVRIHRPGTLIGKALERLPRGTGEILVLLSLQ